MIAVLHILLFHGFKSAAQEIAAFDLTDNTAGSPLSGCHFVNHHWDAGTPYQGSQNGVQAVLMLAANAAELHAQWDKARQNIQPCSDSAVAFIQQLPPGDKVLLVGHSMGGDVIARIIERVTRLVDIYLFVMAAGLDRAAFREMLASRNVIHGINCLSGRDFMLRKQLPEFVSPPGKPAGLYTIDHPKATDYATQLGHADYLHDPAVLSLYREFIDRILRAGP